MDEDDDLLLAAYLDEGALDTIEGTADDAHWGALVEVDLVGGKVDELLIEGLTDADEVLHLAIGDGDGDVLAAHGLGEVMEVLDEALERLDALTGGVGKDEVADGGHELAHLALTTVGEHLDMHGDEAAHSPTLEEGLGLELATKRGAHGEPHGLVGKGLWACFYGCLHGMNV